MSSQPLITGTYVALVTPFDAGGQFDADAFDALIEHVVSGGVDGIVPCGTTGEKSTLTVSEHKRVIERAIARARGRVRVIAGTGSNDTAHAAMMATFAKAAGADAALSVVPYYNKPTQEGLFRHYSHIVEKADIPIVIYNIPGRASTRLEIPTLVRLMSDERVVAIKDATADLAFTMETVRLARRDFSLLSGEDSLTLPMISVGAHGVIAVVANEAPALTTEMVRAALEGEFDLARDIHYRLLPLMRANFLETNPIPVKYALSRMGLIREDCRLPLCPLGDAHRPRMDEALRALRLIA